VRYLEFNFGEVIPPHLTSVVDPETLADEHDPGLNDSHVAQLDHVGTKVDRQPNWSVFRRLVWEKAAQGNYPTVVQTGHRHQTQPANV